MDSLKCVSDNVVTAKSIGLPDPTSCVVIYFLRRSANL